MKERPKITCGCGCGHSDYVNKLRTIEIEGAGDESLRQTFIMKRFMVTPTCYEPFIEELTAMKLLNDHIRRYKRASWLVRLIKMRQVIRLQWLIHERNKGEEVARRMSIRSGLMFISSHRVAGWLHNYWNWTERRNQKPKPCSLTLIK